MATWNGPNNCARNRGITCTLLCIGVSVGLPADVVGGGVAGGSRLGGGCGGGGVAAVASRRRHGGYAD